MRWLLEEIIKGINGVFILCGLLLLFMAPGLAAFFLMWLIGEFQKMLVAG